MTEDREIIRELVRQYARYAQDPVMEERKKLQCAVNDNHMIRPVVLLDEIPWHEMNVDDSLTLRCADPWLRQVEQALRRTLFRQKYFPGDAIIKPWLPVAKVIHTTGNGVRVREDLLKFDEKNEISSHTYEDQFSRDEDLEKLHFETITYDQEETERRYQLLGDLVGDLIPLRKTGIGWFGVSAWDDIATYRGVTPLLMDLMDRPEFMHALVRRLTDIQKDNLRQLEEQGLLDDDPEELHCTAAITSDLPKAAEGEAPTRKNIWGRGAAQIFASVGSAMHEEFEIDYVRETIGTCGLSYYGCCEPLDRKIDIVSRIPNLRKISITPWANVDIAAEAISGRYVIASKPNPAAVAVGHLDEAELRKEIGKILDACKRYGCACDLVLKDISTCHGNPENIFRWEKIVMELAENF